MLRPSPLDETTEMLDSAIGELVTAEPAAGLGFAGKEYVVRGAVMVYTEQRPESAQLFGRF